MEIGEDYARGRLGGDVIGNDIVLSYSNGKITGRCGGVFGGFDVNLVFLAGRLGSSIFGMRFLIFMAPF
ncbi:hypothetical protein L1766_12230 [Thermovorax subterraneus]|nr:hypothetical protein [Thermovorax subterraneus]